MNDQNFDQYVSSLPARLAAGSIWHHTTCMPCPLLNKCHQCKQYKSTLDFYPIKSTSKAGRWGPLGSRVHNCCKECQSVAYKSSSIEQKLFHAAKRRAKQKNLEFAISIEDIKVPSHCPMLGIPLYPTTGKCAHANSPSIDRLDSRKGYTPENIIVISHRANTIKGNATLEELRLIARYTERGLGLIE